MSIFSKRKNNKGFTLVELIIVVAILAILVGVLAPQYTKYVEKSRKSADLNNLNKIVDAIKVAVSDQDYNLGSKELDSNPITYYTIVFGYNPLEFEIADEIYLIRFGCDVKEDQIAEALAEYTGLHFTSTSDIMFEINPIKMKSRNWGKAILREGQFAVSGIAAQVILDNATGSVTVTYSDNIVNYLDHGTIEDKT